MNTVDLAADVNEYIDTCVTDGNRKELKKLIDTLDDLHEAALDSLNDLGDDLEDDSYDDQDDEVTPPESDEFDDGDFGDDLGDGVEEE